MLSVSHLTKRFPFFTLKDVSFTLPRGYIMGFIGRNGAGKSTTLKAIMNIIEPDEGSVEIFGKDMSRAAQEVKQKVSLTLGAFDYYPNSTLKRVTAVYKHFYREWDDDVYQSYCKKFGLVQEKRISELSAGMKVKFSLALALSHKAELFIFDEPTSGLDPIARDELLDVFQELVEDGDKSILFSTHITSDLDKCADYILMICNGEVVANATKDALIDGHALVTGTTDALTDELKARMIAYKTHAYNFTGLIERARLNPTDAVQTEKPNLEDIMVYYNRREDSAQ